jgi:hypothetical protein
MYKGKQVKQSAEQIINDHIATKHQQILSFIGTASI